MAMDEFPDKEKLDPWVDPDWVREIKDQWRREDEETLRKHGPMYLWAERKMLLGIPPNGRVRLATVNGIPIRQTGKPPSEK